MPPSMPARNVLTCCTLAMAVMAAPAHAQYVGPGAKRRPSASRKY